MWMLSTKTFNTHWKNLGKSKFGSLLRVLVLTKRHVGSGIRIVTVVNVTLFGLCPQIIPDQNVLLTAESDWYWDKQSMKWRLNRIRASE